MRYADVSRKEQRFQDCTSMTVKEFEKLLPVFEEEFQEYMKVHCLDGKERVGRGYVTYTNCPLPTAEDRLLFIMVYLKTNNLQVIHGELFGMSQSKANQWIHTLLPVLQSTLRRLGDAPARSMQELAQRWGLNDLPDFSSFVSDDAVTVDDTSPSIPDSSHAMLDTSQDIRSLAPKVPNESCDHLVQEKHDPVDPPLFAMMGPKGAYSVQKTTRNRKPITVERKRLTR
jgi:Helix-turn-helix of DDE superfamily endonuclease